MADFTKFEQKLQERDLKTQFGARLLVPDCCFLSLTVNYYLHLSVFYREIRPKKFSKKFYI